MKNFNKLKKRIKKNEGYSSLPYYDQLNNLTIGFGHLIKKNEKHLIKKKYLKKYFEDLFTEDFNIALKHYKKIFSRTKHKQNIQEVLIEMIYQLGPNKFLMFKKFNKLLSQNLVYLASLEMIDSLWYNQTPKRVEGLISILLNYKNVKK